MGKIDDISRKIEEKLKRQLEALDKNIRKTKEHKEATEDFSEAQDESSRTIKRSTKETKKKTQTQIQDIEILRTWAKTTIDNKLALGQEIAQIAKKYLAVKRNIKATADNTAVQAIHNKIIKEATNSGFIHAVQISDMTSKLFSEEGAINALTVASIKGKDARRDTSLQIAKGQKEREKELKSLKEAILARHKESETLKSNANARIKALKKEKEARLAIMGADAKRSNKAEQDAENKRRRKTIELLKQDILQRHKLSEADRRRRKSLNDVVTQAKIEGKTLKGNVAIIRLYRRALKQGGVAEKQFRHEMRNLKIQVDRTSKSLWGQVLAHSGLNKAVRHAVRNQRNLGGTFSVLRSKILLASFAMMLFQKAIISLVRLHGKQETAERKVHQAMFTTGRRAHIASQEIIEYASELQNLVAISDEVILETSSMLLSFTRIDEAFKETQVAVLNLSAGMGQDLKSSTIQLGKALQAPLQGLTSLSRVGIKFTGEQKKQIADNIHLNKVYAAQKIILDELNKEFGGMAEAIASMTEGELDKLTASMGDLGEKMGKVLAPSILAASQMLRGFVVSVDEDTITNWTSAIISLVSAFASLKIVKWVIQKFMIYRATINAATLSTKLFRLSIAGIIGGIALWIFKSMKGRIEQNKMKEAVIDLNEEAKELVTTLKALAATKGFEAADDALNQLRKQVADARKNIKPIDIKWGTEELDPGIFFNASEQMIDAISAIEDSFDSDVKKQILDRIDRVTAYEKERYKGIGELFWSNSSKGLKELLPGLASFVIKLEESETGAKNLTEQTSNWIKAIDDGVIASGDLLKTFKDVTGQDLTVSISGGDTEALNKFDEFQDKFKKVRAKYLEFAALLREGLSIEVIEKMMKLDEVMTKMRAKDNVKHMSKTFKDFNKNGKGIDKLREKLFGFSEQFTLTTDLLEGGGVALKKFADNDAFEEQRLEILANTLALKTYNMTLDDIRQGRVEDVQAEHLIAWVKEREEIEKTGNALLHYKNLVTENHRLQLKIALDEAKTKKATVLRILEAMGGEDKEKKRIIRNYNIEVMQLNSEEAGYYIQQMSAAINNVAAVMSQGIEARRAKLDAELERVNATIEAEKMSAKYAMASTRIRMKLDKKFEKQKEAAAKKQESARRKLFKQEKRMQVAQAYMNMAQGIVNALTIKPAWLGTVMAVLAGVTGAASIEMINSQQYSRYGGLVRGMPHSAGGTQIQAERGEYVMRREAVRNIGISSMDALNSGIIPSSINNKVNNNQSQNISVSFQGNVMSDEFLEDEAIPKIKEMLRRGSDLG